MPLAQPAPAMFQGNLAWELMHGPLNVIFGLAAGAIGTAVCALTLIWDTRFYRTLIVLILSQCMMLGALKAHFSGAGALGGLMLGAGCSWCWKKGWPKQLALGPDEHYAHETEADLAWLWGLLAQPLLFGVIGTAVNFSVPSSSPATVPLTPSASLNGSCNRQEPPPTALATSSNRLTNHL